MEKIKPTKEQKETFLRILGKIEEYHKEFDKLLKGTTEVDKAFILGSYLWILRVKAKKKMKK